MIAVVGHVEWAEFAPVERVPQQGEIAGADDAWREPAGGGAVAAVQIARLAGECTLLTALGDDHDGHACKEGLEALGVRVESAWRKSPQRRAFVYLDATGERTITVSGERLDPRADEPLPWGELAGADAVYLTAGDVAAVRAARGAKTLVATIRARKGLMESGVRLDALVSSANDAGERYARGDLDPEPEWLVRTEGAGGGSVESASGDVERWEAAPLPGALVDTYGAGDSFAGGLTAGLGRGDDIGAAIELGARCGAACAAGRGPYGGQLRG